LNTVVTELAACQRRREQWRQTTSRLQTQAAAASAELAGRANARVSAPFRDMDSTTLQTELARAEQRLWAATTVAEHHETFSRRWQNRADELTRQLANISDTRPHLSIAETTVAAEREVATRLDQLQSALGRGRLRPNAVRGRARHDLAEEMSRLTRTNPALAVDPPRREDRWATIMDRAKAAEQRWLVEIRAQLDEAVAQVNENTAIASPSRADVDDRAERVATLRAELDRRAKPSSAASRPRSPNIGSDVAPAKGERVYESVTPAVTAVADPAISDRPGAVTGTIVKQSADTDTTEVPPAETARPETLESAVATKRTPTVPARHEQMQQPIEPAPTISEGFV
jgi:hypothetical protein